jgi:hypothetical protein
MPLLSPRRNDSVVHFEHELEVDRAIAFLERKNATRPPESRITLFHLLLRSLVRVLDERPRLNRFVAGGRLWQREGIWITFSAKKRFDDDAPLVAVKRRFEPRETLDAMADRLGRAIVDGKSDRQTTSDREVKWLLRLPRPLARLALWLAHVADAAGLLPRSMIESDPMYASVFVANLGSVGLDAAYHHLWEHGTIPIFCVMGRVREGSDGRRRMSLKYTFDERVEDGLYCAGGLERLRELFQKPELLD